MQEALCSVVGHTFDPEFWLNSWLGGGGSAAVRNHLEELSQAIQSSQLIRQIPGLWEADTTEHVTISKGLQRNRRSHSEDSSTLPFINTKPHRESAAARSVPSHGRRWEFTRSRVSHSPLKCSWELHHSKAPKAFPSNGETSSEKCVALSPLWKPHWTASMDSSIQRETAISESTEGLEP